MLVDHPAPHWLWRLSVWGLVLLVGGVGVLAWGLAQGWADPPVAGPLHLHTDFSLPDPNWTLYPPEAGSLTAGPGGLLITFTAPAQVALALTAAPPANFTVELGGAQTAGEVGAAYGLVFGWQDPTHYSVIVVNGNGYATAYQQQGVDRTTWFAWQQWPHLLAGYSPNQVRLDVRGLQAEARINNERLVSFSLPRAPSTLGLWATSTGPSQVVFNWVKVWAAHP